MKMLGVIEFLVPRRRAPGAGAPTSVISPLLPQTYGSPRFCAGRQAAPSWCATLIQTPSPSLPAIWIGNRSRRSLVPWDATQCMGRSSWARWRACGDGQELPP